MKVLLLDTAFAAAPIYEGLISAGHEVWVMGNRANDLLSRLADDRWINQNYSDVESVKAHIKRLGIDRVVPGCTDVSIETCLRLPVGAHLRDSQEVYSVLGNKALFRSICEKLALPAPKTVGNDSFPREGKYVCKPVDSFSGRGITIFDGQDEEAFRSAQEYARDSSRTKEILIETYAQGDLYSYSGFLENGKFQVGFFVKEGSSVNPFAVDTSFVTNNISPDHEELLKSSLERLAHYLCLKNGLLHTQFILTDEGPLIVELARRCPGDLYSLLIEYSTGYKFAAKYASYFCGYDFSTKIEFMEPIIRHTVAADSMCHYGGLSFSSFAQTRAFYPLSLLGEVLLEKQKTRAGILFSKFDTPQDLEMAYEKFLSRKVYRVNCFS